MSVTREVSQSSGWLKARVRCRGSQAGHTVRGAGCGPGGARRRATEACARTACRGEGATADWADRARGAAHAKHYAHARDAGGVPAQRLVEGVRELPRVARSRAHGAGRAVWAGRREEAGERGVHAAAGESAATVLRLQIGGSGRGEQRTAKEPYMFVTREVSQLSGWLKACAFCRGSQAGHIEYGARGVLRAGRRGRRRASAVRAACAGESAQLQVGGRAAGSSAHKTGSTCS